MALGRAGGATVKLSVDDQQFIRDLVRDEARFKRSTSNMNNELGRLSRGALAGSGAFHGLGRSIAFASTAFLGGAGLGYAVRTAFTELSDATKVAAQTNAVLKSTGAIAGVTAKNVEELGKSLMQVSGVDDEVIKGGENMLLTFTNIRNVAGANNDIFTQATKILLDMNTALGKTGEGTGNLNHTAIQLGKALNDPIRGITALRRVGVNFTESQIALIKTLVQSGHTLEAQKLILQELQVEFGGSAKAAGATFPGQINRLRETLKNLSATLLRDLIPQIERITQRLLKWLDNTKNQQRVQEDFRKAIRLVGQAIAVATKVMETLLPIIRGVTKAVGGAENAFKLLFALGIALKIRGIANSFGTGRGGLASNVGTATGRVGGLKKALAGLPTKLVIQVAIATSIYGPAKKFFEDQFGADYSGISPDATSSAGSPYPKGTDLGDAYEAGRTGKPFPKHVGHTKSADAAYQAGKKARSTQSSSVPSTPSTSPGAAPPTSGSTAGSSSTASSKKGGSSGGTRINWRQYLAMNTSPGQYDCSSFVQMVYRKAFGISLPRTSEAQFASGHPVSSLQEADLVFWRSSGHGFAPPGHVGIYVGNGMVIHDHGMSDTADIVPLRSLASLGYMGARRFVDVGSGAPLPSEGKKGKAAPPPYSAGGFQQPGGAKGGPAVVGGGFIGAGKEAIATAEGVRAGTVSVSLTIPGLGKVLVGTEQKPTIDAIDKQIDQLIKKGKAAVSRRTAKQKALGKLLRVRSKVGRAARNRMIARLRKEIAALTALINDIKEELGALYSTRSDLVAEQQSEAEAAAGEKETGGSSDAGGGGAAGADAIAGSITDLPGDLRLAGAQAAGTPGLEDDLGVLRQQEQIYSARLAGATNIEDKISLTEALTNVRQQIGSVQTATPPDILLAQAQARLTPGVADDRAVTQRLLALTESRLKEATSIEAQIALTNQLVDVRGQLNQLQGQEYSQLIAFLNARRDLARTYASNVLSRYTAGSTINLNMYNQPTPQDPHVWSNQVAFELRALVS